MLSLAALVLATSVPAGGPAPEMRGLWVVRTGLSSPDEVDRIVDEAWRAGLNTLFAQVRGRGDAFYRSALVPRSPLLAAQPEAFDPLARLLARARARGLRVHAWINVLLCAAAGQPLPPGHVLGQRPDWAMVPRWLAHRALSIDAADTLRAVARSPGRGAEGLYLSPSAPGVDEHLEAVVRELLRSYRVDGLHLDFIRYPGPSYDYSPDALVGFSQGQEAHALLRGPSRDPAAWDRYRRDTVTALLARLRQAARAVRPALPVSAAVVPEVAEAMNHRYQDWPAWMRQGLLDAVCPMAYASDPRTFRRQVAGALDVVRPGRPVWVGVGAYWLDLPQIVQNIRLARASGAAGVILFSHEALAAQDLDLLRAQAFEAVPVSQPRPAPAGGGTRPR